MKSTVRAFIAIEISGGVRASARKAIKPLKAAFPDVKWVDDENFHVTLKFLGPNVPTTELHRLIEAVERACRNFEQFDLIFEGLGAFPNPSNPRTIWIGVTDGVDELRRLAKRVDEELEALGYPVESREFSPHLTVGRTRQRDRGGKAVYEEGEFTRRTDVRAASSRHVGPAEEAQENYATLTRMIYDRSNVFLGSSPVDSVVIYSSELERGGPKYEPLAVIDLAALGSVDDEDDDFNPNDYDSEDFKIEEDAMETHLPEVLDTKLDVDALDADLEEELRAICGDSFMKRPNPKSKNASSAPARPNAKIGAKPTKPSNFYKDANFGNRNQPGMKPALKTSKKDDLPELDDLDFSDLDELLKTDGKRGKKRPGR